MSRNKMPLLFLFVLCAVTLFCGSELIDEEDIKAQSFNYKTATVTRMDFVKKASASGTLRYTRTYELRYQGTQANFVELISKKDTMLQEGESVAKVYVQGSRAELSSMQMRLAREEDDYKVYLEKAEEELEKQKNSLYEYTDPIEAKIAKLQYERAQKELEQYKHSTEYELENLRISIADMEEIFAEDTIDAPFTGNLRTVDLSIKEGDSVVRGQSVGLIEDPESLLIVVNDDGALRYNMKVTIDAGARNKRKTYTGVVVASDNLLPYELAQGYSAIKLDEEFDPENMGNITVSYPVISLGNVLTVARNAVKMEKGSNVVSILQDSSVKRRFINFSLYNTEVGLVLQGLNEGDEVILN